MSDSLKSTFFRVFGGLLVVFVLLGVLLVMFTSRMRELEARKNALLLAGQIVSEWSEIDYPQTGVFDSTAIAGGIRFDIRRTVIEPSPGVREMRLYIGRDGGRSIELARKFADI
ncbi:MAG: hypothetical protein JXA64_08075 [Candidatus Fermentibacteraceae bacterium]|nr:hypothetical protein [Candidatus Fermentibacteraceae bacterium]MBN2609056.1 hypothetical protein [Candidatus Fermentibacteraceae bacterium]